MTELELVGCCVSGKVPDGEAALPLLQRQCVRRGQLTGAVQSWYQDLLEDRLNALRSFTGRRASSDG